jgi:hypothetical protein
MVRHRLREHPELFSLARSTLSASADAVTSMPSTKMPVTAPLLSRSGW